MKDSRKDRKAQTLTEGGKKKDGMTINVSHLKLAESMRTGDKLGLAEQIRVVGPNGEVRRKDKVLMDNTNKLEARPTTFKPGLAGFRQEKDKLFK